MAIPWMQISLPLLTGLAWYAALVSVIRLAGKRLAGQTSTIDLIVLITISVVLQQALLGEGRVAAIGFVVTIFTAHKLLAAASRRYSWIRRLLHSAPRPLIRDGHVDYQALREEGLSSDELLAGLRRLGLKEPSDVRLAVLEETGHLSAVPMESKDSSS